MKIEICKNCWVQEGDKVRITSPEYDYPMCAICGHWGSVFDSDFRYVTVNAEILEKEECDCGDHPRHTNGGNPHFAKIKIIKILK